MSFFLLLNTKEDVLVTKQLMGPIDFHSIYFLKSMGALHFLVTSIL